MDRGVTIEKGNLVKFPARLRTLRCAAKFRLLPLVFLATGLLAAVLFILPGRFQVSKAGSRPEESAMQQEIDAIFAPLANAHSPGLAVLVIKDGKKLIERGYGVRVLAAGGKIDARTNFRLASCSKQFTAMSIMLLVRDGKLRYDQTLTDIFPEFPSYGKSITIRNLLNHTGGLQDYETLMEQADAPNSTYPFAHHWTEKNQIQDAEVLTLLERADHGMFAPGTQWYYSNSGYVVLGLVVAKVSGQPFPEFLRRRIFAPLKMDHTVAYQQGKNEVASRAYGHTKEGNAWKQTDQSSTSATLGDGGIYSSLEDLAEWDEALRTHRLLSKEEMEPALTPFVFPDGRPPVWPADSDRPQGSPALYGFGWFLDPYRGHPRMWHYGETMGFHSYIVRFAETQAAPGDALSGTTIIVLCNRTDITPESLALRVADLMLSSNAGTT
jgi:CubicO group peptidase (beta-lactamase class C family)